MFEEQEERSLGKAKPKTDGPKKFAFDWGSMPVTELVKHLDDIRAHLPNLEIKDISIEEQVLLQLHVLRQLQGDCLDDESIPLNQRVGLANSVSAVLKSLGELQNEIWTSERFKRIENSLIRALNTLPKEAAASFLEDYAQIVRQK
jgi:hypothetical protein